MTPQPLLSCPLCCARLAAASLEGHLRYELRLPLVACLLCPQSFVDEQGAREHYARAGAHPGLRPRLIRPPVDAAASGRLSELLRLARGGPSAVQQRLCVCGHCRLLCREDFRPASGHGLSQGDFRTTPGPQTLGSYGSEQAQYLCLAQPVYEASLAGPSPERYQSTLPSRPFESELRPPSLPAASPEAAPAHQPHPSSYPPDMAPAFLTATVTHTAPMPDFRFAQPAPAPPAIAEEVSVHASGRTGLRAEASAPQMVEEVSWDTLTAELTEAMAYQTSKPPALELYEPDETLVTLGPETSFAVVQQACSEPSATVPQAQPVQLTSSQPSFPAQPAAPQSSRPCLRAGLGRRAQTSQAAESKAPERPQKAPARYEAPASQKAPSSTAREAQESSSAPVASRAHTEPSKTPSPVRVLAQGSAAEKSSSASTTSRAQPEPCKAQAQASPPKPDSPGQEDVKPSLKDLRRSITTDGKVACLQCAKRVDKNSFSLHVQALHMPGTPFQCLLCPLESKTRVELTKHQKKDHGVGLTSATFTCTLDREGMKKWIQLCFGETTGIVGYRGTRCKQCDKHVRSQDIASHVASVHLRETLHRCRSCAYGTTYFRKTTVNEHVKRRHHVQPGPDTIDSSGLERHSPAIRALIPQLFEK